MAAGKLSNSSKIHNKRNILSNSYLSFHFIDLLENFCLKSLSISSSKTLPKAQRTRGLSSYHKFKHKSWSNFIFRISTKHLIQNLNQTPAFPQNLSFKILTKPSFRISIQLHNLYKTLAEKTGQFPAANLAWTSTSKSWPTFVLKVWTKV